MTHRKTIAHLGCAVMLLCGTAAAAAQTTVQTITLDEAIRRAQANEPAFASAVAAQKNSHIDSYLAKAALLPTVTYHNQMLYTQPNGQTNQGGQAGTQASPIFIANNAVHEYTSQASINETLGFKQLADSRIASAMAARAAAELEVARRGLVNTVVNLYFGVSASEEKRHLQEAALAEATAFTQVTEKREAAREVARADVIKAQLQQQQRQRDMSDAIVMADKARLELAVLLFPDPLTKYATVIFSGPAPLPTHDEVTLQASTNNPEIRSALADLRASSASVSAAKAAYLPDLNLNFTYGIDAPQLAKRGPDDVRNLGYSMSGTLDIPVWDWFSTQKRVRQSENLRDASKVNLSAAQRRLVANLEEAYAEAAAANAQLDLLGQSVATAAESLRLTKLRYEAGEATALEVVDAQSSNLAAQTAQSDGIIRYEAALANLQILTGTL